MDIYATIDEFKSSLSSGEGPNRRNTHRGLAISVIAGNILKKYKCKREMVRSTGLDRLNYPAGQQQLTKPS